MTGKTHQSVSIRSATGFDSVNITRLIEASWASSQAACAARVSDLCAVQYVASTIKDSHVIVAELSGRLIGALACALMRERWSRPDDWFLCEEWFVISPQWVTRGIPEQLLSNAEEFADQTSLPMLLGGSLMSLPLETLLDRRPGYQRLNAQYLRMPKAAVGDAAAEIERREAHLA